MIVIIHKKFHKMMRLVQMFARKYNVTYYTNVLMKVYVQEF